MEGDNKESSTKSEGIVDDGSKENNNNDNSKDEEIADINNESTTHNNGNDTNKNGSNNGNNHYRTAAAGGSPPPHWVPMQYPPMMMPIPPPYPPPHYLSYARQQHHLAPQAPHSPGNGRGPGSSNNGENRTIWVGDLNSWMDEDYLRNCFGLTREVSSIKVIRNRQTGLPEGYGFVEFTSHASAEKVLQSYSYMTMPNTDQLFRLNWATFGAGDKRSNNNNNGNSNSSDLSIFVGDLASDVTDSLLHETFSSKYPSVKAAKVVMDMNTGRSKGYGFVRFGDDTERSRAMSEMQGFHCSSRPMRIGPATQKKSSGYQSSQGGSSNGASPQASQSDGESANTTIFVGGLDPNVSEEDLKQSFVQYGEIVSVKIPVGKGCGFVQFVNRNDAEEALQQLSGTTIGKQTVRLAWGRNPANRQSDNSDYGPWWRTPYYGGPYFDGYRYPVMNQQRAHYPYMYAPYGAYPFYGTHQQQVS